MFNYGMYSDDGLARLLIHPYNSWELKEQAFSETDPLTKARMGTVYISTCRRQYHCGSTAFLVPESYMLVSIQGPYHF